MGRTCILLRGYTLYIGCILFLTHLALWGGHLLRVGRSQAFSKHHARGMKTKTYSTPERFMIDYASYHTRMALSWVEVVTRSLIYRCFLQRQSTLIASYLAGRGPEVTRQRAGFHLVSRDTPAVLHVNFARWEDRASQPCPFRGHVAYELLRTYSPYDRRGQELRILISSA